MNVATFYRFVPIDDPATLAARLRKLTGDLELRGTILLAHEGINATLAGNEVALRRFVEQLETDPRFANLAVRHSHADADNPVFFRMKVRVRAELIAMHCDGVDPARRTGQHVDAATWNRSTKAAITASRPVPKATSKWSWSPRNSKASG